ncbi:MAG: hypothetical protein ACOC0U_05180 [Desulfovibrionales bacterium]
MTLNERDLLERRLEQLLGTDFPSNSTDTITAALELAEHVQSRGFSFQLKDLCPRSLHESAWSAVFSNGEAQFTAEDSQASIAVCTAAVKALESGETD